MKKSIDNSLYKNAIKNYEKNGAVKLGPLSSQKFIEDPQYIMFQMSRYKHACRLVSNKSVVADIGVGDGIGLGVLSLYFKKIYALDIDDYLLNSARNHNQSDKVLFRKHNFYKGKLNLKLDAAFCFDVLSSIPKRFENRFLGNIANSLKKDGILVIGTQNKLATRYSKLKNIQEQPNFKTYDQLNKSLLKHFNNSLILSMNDETVHTGKRETSQYFIAIGIGVK